MSEYVISPNLRRAIIEGNQQSIERISDVEEYHRGLAIADYQRLKVKEFFELVQEYGKKGLEKNYLELRNRLLRNDLISLVEELDKIWSG